MGLLKQEIILANESHLKDIVGLNSQFHLNVDGFKWDQPGFVEEEIKKGNYHVLVENGSVLGAINVKKQGKSEMYIETIAVSHKYQGSGLGKILVNFAKDLAIKKGCNKLTVESFKSYNLYDFYTKVGFKLDNPPIGNSKGVPFHRFLMLL